MGFIEFSSGDVDYLFDGVNHALARRHHRLFSGIDALVIEKTFAFEFVPEGLGERLWFVSYFGNKSLLQQLKIERTPVFSVDVRTEPSDSDLLYDIPTLRHYWYGLLYQCSKRSVPSHVQRYISDVNHAEQDIGLAGRSSISSEKITNYLVERIKRDRSIIGRGVRIGLIYGFNHIDIVDYIKSEERRTEAIAYHQKLGFGGLVTEDLDVLLQYHYVPHGNGCPSGGWRATRENMGLFEGNRLKRLS